jgi:hypothetical protein
MIKGANNKDVRQSYEMRRDALKAVITIEEACKAYRARFHTSPSHIDQLISTGLLVRLPKDPYGGAFYLDSAGRVRSSSKFAMPLSSTVPLKEP